MMYLNEGSFFLRKYMLCSHQQDLDTPGPYQKPHTTHL